jgi:hypothetical protein
LERNSGEFDRKRTFFRLFLDFFCGGKATVGLGPLFEESTFGNKFLTRVSSSPCTLDRDSIMNQTGPECTVKDVPGALVYAIVNFTPAEGLSWAGRRLKWAWCSICFVQAVANVWYTVEAASWIVRNFSSSFPVDADCQCTTSCFTISAVCALRVRKSCVSSRSREGKAKLSPQFLRPFFVMQRLCLDA